MNLNPGSLNTITRYSDSNYVLGDPSKKFAQRFSSVFSSVEADDHAQNFILKPVDQPVIAELDSHPIFELDGRPVDMSHNISVHSDNNSYDKTSTSHD